MKIKEINVSRSGVIPVASYENLRPGYSITVELDENDNKEKVVTDLNEYLRKMFEVEAHRCKAEWLSKLYENIRWYPRNGQQFPSVTSILFLCGQTDPKTFWITDHDSGQKREMTSDELQQYASRGNVIEARVEHFLTTGKWVDPNTLVPCRDDIEILTSGNLHLSWSDGSCKAFFAEFGGKIKVETFQKTVYNDEHLYAGTMDILGTFENKRTVFDIKSGAFDMRQLAAYAACEEKIKQLVVLPVGPTDNKCGYKKPVICTTIANEFQGFLHARAKFRQRFGL